jgi:hypothetical protein
MEDFSRIREAKTFCFAMMLIDKSGHKQAFAG